MDHFLTPGLVIDASSGLLFVALGVFVFLVRRDRKANRMFALASVGFGSSILVSNLGFVPVSAGQIDFLDPRVDAFLALSMLFALTAACAMVRLALLFPRPLPREGRGMVLLPLLLAFLFWAMVLEWYGFRGPGAIRAMYMGVLLFMFSSFLFMLALLPIRHALEGSLSPHQRKQIRMLALALVFWPALISGGSSLNLEYSLYSRAVGVSVLFIIACTWLYALSRAPVQERRAVMVLAWGTLGLALVGMLAVVVAGDYPAALDSGIMGIARTVGFGVLAYAILRDSLFDIELKIRWALGKGTLAVMFLATFFVVANVAQGYFQTTFGWALGGVAAGLLFLVISPLQRLADRVASAAVPGVSEPGYLAMRKEEVYRATLEEILCDGVVSTKERRTLFRLQEELGLSSDAANRLERQVVDRSPSA